MLDDRTHKGASSFFMNAVPNPPSPPEPPMAPIRRRARSPYRWLRRVLLLTGLAGIASLAVMLFAYQFGNVESVPGHESRIIEFNRRGEDEEGTLKHRDPAGKLRTFLEEAGIGHRL